MNEQYLRRIHHVEVVVNSVAKVGVSWHLRKLETAPNCPAKYLGCCDNYLCRMTFAAQVNVPGNENITYVIPTFHNFHALLYFVTHSQLPKLTVRFEKVFKMLLSEINFFSTVVKLNTIIEKV